MKIFFIFCFLTIVYWKISYAQFTDNFSDGDFTSNPLWNGDQGNFIIETGQLKLQAPALASSSYLCTSSVAINNAVWEFFVQFDFNPSSANLSNIYLISDLPDLSGSLNGYFIKVGNTADEVSLYRQDGTTEVKIIDGTDKILNTTSVQIKIKVTRDDQGNWQLFNDVGVTGNYVQDGTAVDNTYQSSSFFGVRCKYTSTRSDKFRFDDFVITGDPMQDLIPPTLNSVKVISSNQLDLLFSENLEQFSSESLVNYNVNNGIGNPSMATLQADQKTINLFFENKFPNGVNCKLTASGIKDIAGNLIAFTENDFLFFYGEVVNFKDVIITEIFTDPDPQIGLPNAEYVELLNRSVNPVDLADWQLTDGSSKAYFSSKILFPGEYLVVTSSLASQQFTNYGSVLGVNNFPTLNNLSDVVILKEVNGLTIDSVSYTSQWYQDTDKKEGGWSLEIIDPNNMCAASDNWIASEDISGGTPAKQNSIYAEKPDLTGPKLLSITATINTIILKFNEKLEKQLPNLLSFSIEPAVQVVSVAYQDEALTTLILTTAEIQPKKLYSITVQNVYDCAGNNIQTSANKMEFGLPEQPEANDLVINEILFNPRPTGVDFVEIYNRSSKFINLKNFSVVTYKDQLQSEKKFITTTDFVFAPSSYAALTENGNVLKGEYIMAQEENFIELAALPAFNDDEGNVAIMDDSNQIIDQFSYAKAMHSFYIKDEEGVSLERVDFNNPSNDNQNWKSASTTSGYATPGYQNSNSLVNTAIQDGTVKVEPEIFIPVTGQPDFTQIMYSFDQGGYSANIYIYDTQGREIKQLANNQLIGTEGFFRWDGDLNNGTKARVGYYIVAFDVFNSSGVVKTFRKRVVVATKF